MVTEGGEQRCSRWGKSGLLASPPSVLPSGRNLAIPYAIPLRPSEMAETRHQTIRLS